MHIMMTVNAAWNIWNFRRALVQALLADGHRVTVLAPPDDSVRKLEQLGCGFMPLEMSVKGLNPLQDLKLIQRYKRIFRTEQPDIVLSYTIKNNIFGAMAARACAIPFIPNVTGLGTAFLSGGLLQRVAEGLYRRAFGPLPVVFFQNDDDFATLCRAPAGAAATGTPPARLWHRPQAFCRQRPAATKTAANLPDDRPNAARQRCAGICRSGTAGQGAMARSTVSTAGGHRLGKPHGDQCRHGARLAGGRHYRTSGHSGRCAAFHSRCPLRGAALLSRRRAAHPDRGRRHGAAADCHGCGGLPFDRR